MPLTVAIHQPNYLPWPGFFYKIYRSNIFVFLDNVQYGKQQFANRCGIKTPQGFQWLSVPVRIGLSHKQTLNTIPIDNQANWRHKHLKTLQTFYGSTRYFKSFEKEFIQIYKTPWTNLIDLNLSLITLIIKILGLNCRFMLASELELDPVTNNNLGICKFLNADIYLSGDGSAEYLKEHEFLEEDIQVQYTLYKIPEYPQKHGQFIGYTSILDMLFNCGPDWIQSHFRTLAERQP